MNYSFLANKDGKLAWRPFELIHPAIYVSLVNAICHPDNWEHIKTQLAEFEGGAVECCSAPVVSLDNQTDVATQIRSWWQSVEQRSLIYSLEFGHVLHTDVTDCYGSLYTHSIAWALHGLPELEEEQERPLSCRKQDKFVYSGKPMGTDQWHFSGFCPDGFRGGDCSWLCQP